MNAVAGTRSERGDGRQLYYVAIKQNLGNFPVFHPDDFYEKLERNASGEWVLSSWWIDNSVIVRQSDVEESRFFTSPHASLVALGREVNPGRYYIYATDEVPDIDLSALLDLDFSATGEVRYRRPVHARLVGTIHVDNHLNRMLHRLSKACFPDPQSTYFNTSLARRMIRWLSRWRPFAPIDLVA